MATRYEIKSKQFQKALLTLEDALKKDRDEYMRDSIIQRFEYSVELFWKMLKEYLYEFENIEVRSPNHAMRESRNIDLLSDKETEYALEMIHDRNQSSHAYDEDIAEGISGKIDSYAEFMRKVFLGMNEPSTAKKIKKEKLIETFKKASKDSDILDITEGN